MEGKKGMMQVTIGKLGTHLLITAGHYSKLRVLYDMHGGCKSQGDRFDVDFHSALALLLLRYNSLNGGSTKGLGGGFQGAINEEVFDVLLRRFDCRLECFASPLNCRYSGFCSAFADTDTSFGSIGDFFSFRPREGCYEANPPFTAVLMLEMVQHMEELLLLADGDNDSDAKKSLPLCFIVILPACGGGTSREIDSTKDDDGADDDGGADGARAAQLAASPSWEALHGCTYFTRHLRVKAKEHGYIEGSQQSRPTRYKTSAFDTSVFFLQTRAAAKKWPVTGEVCKELQAAFRSKHLDEVEQRKGGGSDNGGSGRGFYDGVDDAEAKKQAALSRLMQATKKKRPSCGSSEKKQAIKQSGSGGSAGGSAGGSNQKRKDNSSAKGVSVKIKKIKLKTDCSIKVKKIKVRK
jgi:hypothetical protein